MKNLNLKSPDLLSAFKRQVSDNKELKKLSDESQKAVDEVMNTPFYQLHNLVKLIGPSYKSRTMVVGGVNLINKINKISKKYLLPRKIAKLFSKNLVVSKFEILKLIMPTVLGPNGKRKKISKKDYLYSKKKYDQILVNKLKYLKRELLKIGYLLKIKGETVQAVKSNDVDAV